MNLNHSDRAQVLVEALPYIQRYYGKTVVIKYGGNAMISEELKKAVISDIILLRLVGIHVVVVHGGGPEINELLKKTGKESKFVNGLRYTDEETMEAVQMVLCGKVNKDLVATLNRAGGQAVGLCGLDGGMLKAVRRQEEGVDYGLVGDVTEVDPKVILDAIHDGFIPVVSTVAQGTDQETSYNVNADTAAARIAVAVGAVSEACSEISGWAGSGNSYSCPVMKRSLSVLRPPDSPPIMDRKGVRVGEAVNSSPAKLGRLKVLPVPVTMSGIVKHPFYIVILWVGD